MHRSIERVRRILMSVITRAYKMLPNFLRSVRAIDRQVVLLVIEVAGPSVIHERVKPVPSTFVGSAILSDVHARHAAGCPETRNQSPRSTEDSQPIAQWHLIFESSNEPFTEKEVRPQSKYRDNKQQFNDRKRLPDVAANLGRIDEVFKRDVIQPTVELTEKQRLNDHKQWHKHENDAPTSLHKPTTAASQQPLISAKREMPQLKLHTQQCDKQIEP